MDLTIYSNMVMAKELLKQEHKWVDLELPDLRSLPVPLRTVPPEERLSADNHEEGIALLADGFGFSPGVDEITIDSKFEKVHIRRTDICHIAEKRQDARERYVLFALDTIYNPFEVWLVSYDDGSSRFAFISAYTGKKQILVVVTWDGRYLWNFMQCDAKKLNKHRHGLLIYKRYSG